jgi:hypothetical protein
VILVLRISFPSMAPGVSAVQGGVLVHTALMSAFKLMWSCPLVEGALPLSIEVESNPATLE